MGQCVHLIKVNGINSASIIIPYGDKPKPTVRSLKDTLFMLYQMSTKYSFVPYSLVPDHFGWFGCCIAGLFCERRFLLVVLKVDFHEDFLKLACDYGSSVGKCLLKAVLISLPSPIHTLLYSFSCSLTTQFLSMIISSGHFKNYGLTPNREICTILSCKINSV